jgi:hypothetical protein
MSADDPESRLEEDKVREEDWLIVASLVAIVIVSAVCFAAAWFLY